ncbi:hypothetical protein ACFWIE_16765, partial [Kitasatospora griseola]
MLIWGVVAAGAQIRCVDAGGGGAAGSRPRENERKTSHPT